MLIFTAFADTADYLYGDLADWAQETLGLHTAMVTGGSHGNRRHRPGSASRHRVHPDRLLARLQGARADRGRSRRSTS
ncbi:MAG: hypothetical protein U5L11_00985 [Arhodomonas sp.]|nr:hypothetical protein [Arhodomonas sp.]